MVNGAVRDTASAKRIAEGLLAQAIEALERGTPPAEPEEPAQEFEKWLATYSTLSSARDENGYTDMTTEMLWHTWQAATKTKAPEGASDEVIDASARPDLAGVDYTCAHDFAVQPSSGIRLCQKCGISETAARKAAPQQEAHHLTQALSDPENQPNQYGVEFGMSGPQMHFKIGNQLFRLAYEPDAQEEFEFMKRMLINAFSTFTSHHTRE